MSLTVELQKLHNLDIHDILTKILKIQQISNIQIMRKEGELLFLIKDDPGQPVKYYMNKSGMSARWFNEILRQLLASKLVEQGPCAIDSRRRLLR